MTCSIRRPPSALVQKCDRVNQSSSRSAEVSKYSCTKQPISSRTRIVTSANYWLAISLECAWSVTSSRSSSMKFYNHLNSSFAYISLLWPTLHALGRTNEPNLIKEKWWFWFLQPDAVLCPCRIRLIKGTSGVSIIVWNMVRYEMDGGVQSR